jgi:small-conductance mechanosensitive channel
MNHKERIWDPKNTSGKVNSSITKLAWAALVLILLCLLFHVVAQPIPVLSQAGPTSTPAAKEPSEAPNRVEVEPTVRDEAIEERLRSILDATGWFIDPQVHVQEGVVFLTGQASSADHRSWAGDLARNTQDVVAVVNQMDLTQPSVWDFGPAWNELRELWVNLVRSLPIVGFSLLVLLITWFLSQVAARGARRALQRRLSSPLLCNVGGYAAGIITFLIGLYIVLQVAGLTNMALTVMGGTGLLGLVLGIAFRDITENFLASIFLSLQNPFRTGDLVNIAGVEGFVQALTTRATILMTLDGNHVQIPNATVYKSNISNFSSNPKRRADFLIGIGYDDAIADAQETALKVLQEHPAVLKDPEPLILVESLGSATVNIQSSVIRLIKRAFQAAGISMPDEAREMIFPQGVPVHLLGGEDQARKPMPAQTPVPERPVPSAESSSISTDAEAGLSSEAETIREQARTAWKPEDGENLLKSQ